MSNLPSIARAELHVTKCRADVERKLFDIVFDTVITAKRGADVAARVSAAFPSIPRDLSLRVSSELLRIRSTSSPEEPFTDKMHAYVHDASHLITMTQVP